MRLKKLMACLSVVGLMVVVMGVSSPGRAEAAEITLNMGHPFPEKLETLTSWEKPAIFPIWSSPAAWT